MVVQNRDNSVYYFLFLHSIFFFFFKQKTAYEMRISDWSSDVCSSDLGPGAANASLGIHTAHQDSTPVILFLGQVASYMLEREAFQEVDFRHMFKPMADRKSVV